MLLQQYCSSCCCSNSSCCSSASVAAIAATPVVAAVATLCSPLFTSPPLSFPAALHSPSPLCFQIVCITSQNPKMDRTIGLDVVPPTIPWPLLFPHLLPLFSNPLNPQVVPPSDISKMSFLFHLFNISKMSFSVPFGPAFVLFAQENFAAEEPASEAAKNLLN